MSSKTTTCGCCTKMVYPMDQQIKLDSISYHTKCAKCAQCGTQINLNNFAKAENTLYCQTHFAEKFRKEGGYISAEKLRGSLSPSEPSAPVEVHKKLRCGTCGNPVYPMEPQIKLDGVPFHTACAKCTECKTQIHLNNFAKANELLYCKVHFAEKFRKEGGYVDKLKTNESIISSEPLTPVEVDKKLKCGSCGNAVYPMEPQIKLDGTPYHTTCAKCVECNSQIGLNNFAKDGMTLYCKTHYLRKFQEKGSYLGGEKFAKSPNPDAQPVEVDKKLRCGSCGKAVYPMESQVKLDGTPYHTSCAKCTECECQISLNNFAKVDMTLYCKTHYLRKMMKEGEYAGSEKFQRRGSYKTSDTSPLSKDFNRVPSPTSGLKTPDGKEENIVQEEESAPPGDAEGGTGTGSEEVEAKEPSLDAFDAIFGAPSTPPPEQQQQRLQYTGDNDDDNTYKNSIEDGPLEEHDPVPRTPGNEVHEDHTPLNRLHLHLDELHLSSEIGDLPPPTIPPPSSSSYSAARTGVVDDTMIDSYPIHSEPPVKSSYPPSRPSYPPARPSLSQQVVASPDSSRDSNDEKPGKNSLFKSFGVEVTDDGDVKKSSKKLFNM